MLYNTNPYQEQIEVRIINQLKEAKNNKQLAK